ncbi:hypothetical protein SAMN02745126_05234 [Enhydrobacter aerosaccus]|uniref:Uncharacterized protein n=1 Tax=Enhydrobacter aerosaccus TaxID=225324 RepID=A0A1T4SWU1_9HYPH|nr:hypothetical protein [Enhydrobacter aerosaccus]SKA32388.1 hypothetical protein SAMN02745126_05234 [Enhydrobacter aerosaccus]
MTVRFVAWTFLAIAVAILVDDCLATRSGPFRLQTLGIIWSRIDYPSLRAIQDGVANHLSGRLWHFVLKPVLMAPACPVFAAAGAILLWLARRLSPQPS